MLSHADLQFRLGDEAEDCEDVFSEGDMYYTEFLAATFDRSHIDSKICKAAFAVFDQDGNAQITAEELSRPESMLGYLSPEETQQLLEDFDQDGDGTIDIGELQQRVLCVRPKRRLLLR